MSNSKTATSANTAGAVDPSLAWPNVRITSSTSIQTIVSSSLLHLSDPSSAPLILHTLPSPSNSNSTTTTSIIAKNSHAGLCKLISVVEIIKREFENHQKETWRLEDEKLRKKLAKKNEKSIKKGKKRVREEDEYEAEPPQAQAADEGAVAQAQEDVAVASTSKDTLTTNKTSAKDKTKQRPLLRVYQYNILDAYERLPGASKSSNDDSDADSPSSDSEDDEDGEEDDEARESSKVEADLVKSKIKAAKSLNDAIHTHVIRAKKRPKKKHTPYMKIILSTRKLTEYENYLKSSANGGRKDYTIQLPQAKKSRSRTSKRKHKKSNDEVEEGEAVQESFSTNVVEKGNMKLTVNQSEASAKDTTKSSTATQADEGVLIGQKENTSTSSGKKSKKRKVDDMETQSTEATQKSSQLS